MDEISVTGLEPGAFAVTIGDGTIATTHRVKAPPHVLADLGVSVEDGERAVRESIMFLLEREPPTSILREFSLDDIARYFPDYMVELRKRLAA